MRATLAVLVGLAVLWVVTGAVLDVVPAIPEWLSLIGFLIAGGITVAIVRRMPERVAAIDRVAKS